MGGTENPMVIAANIDEAGLGNRMRFTLSAQSLAEATGREFKYVWPVRTFGAHLRDLWDFNPSLEMEEQTSLEITLTYPKVSEKVRPPDEQAVWHFRSAQALPLPKGAMPWTVRLKTLVPTEGVQRRVLEMYDQSLADAAYVGVMIRAHEKSHAQTLTHSPVEWYLQRMKDLTAANPGVKFFVSCDVPDVQEQVLSSVPGSFGLTNKGDYGSKAGIVSSVVDLYLLASSSYMLTPYWSSFPTLAWYLAAGCMPMENSQSGRAESDVLMVPATENPLRPHVRRAR